MVGQVDDRLFIGESLVFDLQLAADQRIAHLYVQVAGITLFAVGAVQGERQRVAVAAFKHIIPQAAVEADFAAVQMVAVVVLVQVVIDAVDDHVAFIDTVRTSADQRAQIAAVLLVAGDVVIP